MSLDLFPLDIALAYYELLDPETKCSWFDPIRLLDIVLPPFSVAVFLRIFRMVLFIDIALQALHRGGCK